MEKQADDVTGGEQTADWIVRSVEYLRLSIDMQSAEGECDTTGDRIGPVRRFVDGISPIGLFRADAFGAAAV